MPLTQDQYEALIQDSLYDPDGVLVEIVPLLFKKHEDISPLKLRALFVQRDALVALMGSVREKFDNSEKDRRNDLSNQFKHLREMYELTLSDIQEIKALERTSATGRFVSDQLTTVQPIPNPVTEGADGGHIQYAGSPYYPRRRPQ